MTFEFEERGEGPALLFIPGSYSNGAAWRGIQKALQGSYRMITTSLPGYGRTAEIRNETVSDMTEMSDFVAMVVDRVGEPVHIIGHSYGGLAIFAAILSGKIAPESIITFEANPVYSQPVQGDFHWKEQAKEIGQRLEQAFAAGDADAPGLIIDYWSKPGTFAALPEAVRNYCRDTVYSNILDWRTAMGFTPGLLEYAAIKSPVTIVRGAYANQAIVDLSEAIAAQIKDSALHVVPGADHFLISTHPVQCAALIDMHMQAYGEG